MNCFNVTSNKFQKTLDLLNISPNSSEVSCSELFNKEESVVTYRRKRQVYNPLLLEIQNQIRQLRQLRAKVLREARLQRQMFLRRQKRINLRIDSLTRYKLRLNINGDNVLNRRIGNRGPHLAPRKRLVKEPKSEEANENMNEREQYDDDNENYDDDEYNK